MVQNYMETLVDNALKSEFRDHPDKYVSVCKCPSCIAYIKATALNDLAPFYVTSLAGEVFGEYQNKGLQQMAEVLVAIGKGMDALERLDPHGNGGQAL